MIDNYKRYQKGFKIEMLFPKRSDGKCSCGCGKKLEGRKKKWFEKSCLRKSLNLFFIIKGDTKIIRQNLFIRDQGYCNNCGVYDDKWQADHITPVFKGGGACSLDNLQTLCQHCHNEKSFYLDRIPNSNNVLTASFNILPPSYDTSRALNERVCENIIG